MYYSLQPHLVLMSLCIVFLCSAYFFRIALRVHFVLLSVCMVLRFTTCIAVSAYCGVRLYLALLPSGYFPLFARTKIDTYIDTYTRPRARARIRTRLYLSIHLKYLFCCRSFDRYVSLSMSLTVYAWMHVCMHTR